MSLPTCKLRNGTEEPRPLVLTTTMAIDRLESTMPLALHDLVELARTGAKPFGPCGERLAQLRLVEPDGRMNQSVRNVVLSSFEGDGLDLVRVSPVSPPAPSVPGSREED